MFRSSLLLALLALVGLSVSSCIQPPDFSDTPEIEFKSIKIQRLPDRASGITLRDSITITLKYQDGDGDLGLNNDDPPTTFGEPNYNNYLIKFQVQRNGVFRDTTFISSFDSRFPRLTSNEKAAPIRGDLSFAIDVYQNGLPIKTPMRMRVQIIDRAFHKSNEVYTDVFQLQPY